MGDAWAANMYLQVDRRRVALLVAIQDGLPKQRHILAGIAASCICTYTRLMPGPCTYTCTVRT